MSAPTESDDGYERMPLSWDRITSLEAYLEATRSMTQPYTIPAMGYDIIVLPPHVMSPAFDCASHFLAETLVAQLQGGERVLDIGCGCGILSVLASRAGAGHVTALDINPYAVENTELNFEKHSVTGTVVCGAAFDGLGPEAEPFDLMVFNAPFCRGEPKNYLEMGALDPEYRLLRTVVLQAHRYLVEGGRLALGFSETDGDATVLDGLIAESRFRECDRRRKHAYGEIYLSVLLEAELT